MRKSLIYSELIVAVLMSILYGFNILAMHYIIGLIPFISIIIICILLLIKKINNNVKDYIVTALFALSIISVPVSHIISITNPFTYKCENISDGLEITGYRYNILNDYGNYVIEIPSEINNKKVKSIGEYAFYYSKHFDELVIPEGVETIKGWAFAYANYNNLSFPNTLKRIEYCAFYQHDITVDYVVIPNSLEYIGVKAFFCSVRAIILEEGTNHTDFDEQCFLAPSGIYYEVVGTEILDGVLYVLYSNGMATVAKIKSDVTSVNIKETLIYNNQNYIVTSIGDYAGAYCNFDNIYIPNTIYSIGCEAFKENDTIKEIYIPNSVIDMGYLVFFGCSNIIINVGFENKPLGWSNYWNPNNYLVNWNVKP